MNQSIRNRALFALIILSFVASACGAQPAEAVVQSDLDREQAPNLEPGAFEDLSSGNQAFAFDLYRRLASSDGNLFFSPHSISLALAMTYAGAQGETKREMAETLHFQLADEQLHAAFNALDLDLARRGGGNEENQPFELNIANAIWGEQTYHFLQKFLDVLAVNYGAGLRLLDFVGDPDSSRQVINEWVSDQTEGKIQELIPEGSIDALTRLVLTNAIYFNADWQSPFKESDTAEGTFTTLDGSTVSVPMMSQLGDFAYGESAGVQVIELPYYGDEASMVLFLPAEGEFSAFERSLNSETLQTMLADLELKSVNLRMPKFEFASEFELVSTLAEMGMPSAFSPEADFSRMDGTRDLAISGVLHKAYVAVDEAGTEAAAATGVIVGVTSVPLSDVDLVIDRPFVFGIRDNSTGTLLFLGRVLDPA